MDEPEPHQPDRDDALARRLAALAGAAPDEDGANAVLVLAVSSAATNGRSASAPDADAVDDPMGEPAIG